MTLTPGRGVSHALHVYLGLCDHWHMKLWPWPWNSCGASCVQDIWASVFKFLVCTPPTRHRCVHWHVLLILWPLTFAARVSTVFELQLPNSMCPLPVMSRCVLACFWNHTTLDFDAATLTLTFCGQGIDHTVSKLCICTGIFMTLLSLTLNQWPWPWPLCLDLWDFDLDFDIPVTPPMPYR